MRCTSLAALAGTALAVAGASLLLPSTVTYDPWSWLIWGRQIAAGTIDTVAGPAWKPLPVAVTALAAPLGEAAVTVWLLIARAGALLAVLTAARLAWRMAPRATAAPAAAAAALGVALTEGWIWNAGVGNAEGLALALGLVAVDRHIDGRRGQALAAGTAAALIRVEAWPLLVAYALWLAVRHPRTRAAAAAAVLAVPALWLVPDRLGSGRWDRSADRARVLEPGAPGLSDHPVAASLAAALGLAPPLVLAGAALAVVLAARRRLPAPAVAVLAGCVAWSAVVALMAATGTSGEARYHLPAAAALAVPAAVAGAVALGAAAARATVAARAAAVTGLAALLVVPALPGAGRQAARVGDEASLYGGLGTAVAAAGGPAAVRACGPVGTGPLSVPALAWRLGVPIGRVSKDAVARGTVFRAPPAPGLPPAPAGAAPPRVAAHGPWEVLQRCAARS
jgi:hypothetical protein